MAVFRISNDGKLHLRFSYEGSTYIESIHFSQLLKGQKVVCEVEQGEELSPIENPNDFDFGDDD